MVGMALKKRLEYIEIDKRVKFNLSLQTSML